MDKKKKISKAGILYLVSMVLGVTIVVMGFSIANDAKNELQKQKELAQSAQTKVEKTEKSKEVAKVAEKVEKDDEVETVVLPVAKPEQKKDEFAPKLENYVLTKPAEGSVSVQFTGESLVYSKYYDDWSVHKGIDIAAKGSSQVKAAANGTVKSVYNDSRLGLVIVLQHGDFTTVYGNLTTDTLVKVGDKVFAGDIISGVGKSPEGKEFLHFELKYKEKDIDPEPLFNW